MTVQWTRHHIALSSHLLGSPQSTVFRNRKTVLARVATRRVNFETPNIQEVIGAFCTSSASSVSPQSSMPSRLSTTSRPRWRPEEDAQLIKLVEEYGVGNWAAISRGFKGIHSRDQKAVRSRWVYHLDPNINKGPFTEEEEEIILEQYARVGSHWAEISRALPGRTDGAIKNLWNSRLMKRYPNWEAAKGKGRRRPKVKVKVKTEPMDMTSRQRRKANNIIRKEQSI